MSLSYEFSIGSVRVKENSLLTKAEIENLLGCDDAAELVKVLNDKGYAAGTSVDEVLEDHTNRMWDYLESIVPDLGIFNPFLYRNDVHNLKTAVKGVMADREYESLFLRPCTVDTDVIKEAAENKKLSLLPQWLAEPAAEAYEILAHTGDARLSDAVADKALMKQMLEYASKSGSEFLNKYFKTYVFYADIKIVLRGARTGTSRDYLKKALCEVDGLAMSAVTDAALKGSEVLADLLSKCGDYECDKAFEQYKNSPGAFERFVENLLMNTAKECCRLSSEGAEPVIGYYLGCEAEHKAIHIIACGLRTNSDKEIIRERLREVYV